LDKDSAAEEHLFIHGLAYTIDTKVASPKNTAIPEKL